MSNFVCKICNTAIYEGFDGKYITGCPHYPLNQDEKKKDDAVEEIKELFNKMGIKL